MIWYTVVSSNYNMQHLQIEQRQRHIVSNNKNKHTNKSKNRILIVDEDSADNDSTLRLDLEQNGFIVNTFTDPLLALNHFSAGLFDMVVLNKKMSKMKAIDLHKKFKEIDHKVRICILGSYDTYGA